MYRRGPDFPIETNVQQLYENESYAQAFTGSLHVSKQLWKGLQPLNGELCMGFPRIWHDKYFIIFHESLKEEMLCKIP